MKRTILTLMALTFILVSTAAAKEFSADMISVMSGMKDKGKVYYKNSTTYRTEIMGLINIVKKPSVYQIFQDTKKYHVSDMEDIKKKNPMADADNFNEWVKENNLKKVKTEKFQGYKCDVYEGTIKMDEKQDPLSMKIWYSKKLDYPLKSESTLPAPMGKVTGYIENIKLGKQPASLFKLPAGYTKAKTMEEAMGIGNLPDFGNLKPGETPSEEDMNEMMKKMQEMMKKKQ